MEGEGSSKTLKPKRYNYQVALVLGKAKKLCKVEVHLKCRAFRLTMPRVPVGQQVQYPWKSDVLKAWEAAKAKCVEIVDGVA